MTFIRSPFIRSLCLLLLLGSPAGAADVVYPTGSRIGLAPPPGMESTSTSFMGFEDRENQVAIVAVALPPEAYARLEESATTAVLKGQGLTVDKREPLDLAAGKAFLITGHQTEGAINLRKWLLAISTADLTALITVQMPDEAAAHYPDATIRSALESITVRASVPVEEQLSLLPFKVGELAGFHVLGVSPGRAVVLSDATSMQSSPKSEARVVIGIAPGAPAQVGDRDNFAREVFATVPGITDVRITNSEPLRIGGMIGHQIMANGKDGASGLDIMLVQWLRFGSGAFLQIVGLSRADEWPQAYPRFRSVRDGVEAK